MLGILTMEDGHRIPVTLPLNATLTLVDGIQTKDRMVDVVWEGKTVAVFAVDLKARTAVVRAARG
jgi:hypothetical protein